VRISMPKVYGNLIYKQMLLNDTHSNPYAPLGYCNNHLIPLELSHLCR